MPVFMALWLPLMRGTFTKPAEQPIRTPPGNDSLGTDHGTAGPMFVFGRGVQGGHYGSRPSLTDLDEGDLRASTDFRDVYGSMLTGVLGTDPGQVLNGWTNTVPRLFGCA